MTDFTARRRGSSVLLRANTDKADAWLKEFGGGRVMLEAGPFADLAAEMRGASLSVEIVYAEEVAP